ncbi:hypothetical protein Hanom_Chr03g00239181 [Helianthus anomalus]
MRCRRGGRREGGEREERGRLGPINDFFFFFLKKTIHLRGEWRHQMGVLGEFKRGVDVAHGDWFDVREGTRLLGEHPLHPDADAKEMEQSTRLMMANSFEKRSRYICNHFHRYVVKNISSTYTRRYIVFESRDT